MNKDRYLIKGGKILFINKDNNRVFRSYFLLPSILYIMAVLLFIIIKCFIYDFDEGLLFWALVFVIVLSAEYFSLCFIYATGGIEPNFKIITEPDCAIIYTENGTKRRVDSADIKYVDLLGRITLVDGQRLDYKLYCYPFFVPLKSELMRLINK